MEFKRTLSEDEAATLQYIADKHNAYLDRAAETATVPEGEERQPVQHETAEHQLNRIITNALAEHKAIQLREEEEAHLAEWRAARG